MADQRVIDNAAKKAKTKDRIKRNFGVSEFADIFPVAVRPTKELGFTALSCLHGASKWPLGIVQGKMLEISKNSAGAAIPMSYKTLDQLNTQLNELYEVVDDIDSSQEEIDQEHNEKPETQQKAKPTTTKQVGNIEAPTRVEDSAAVSPGNMLLNRGRVPDSKKNDTGLNNKDKGACQIRQYASQPSEERQGLTTKPEFVLNLQRVVPVMSQQDGGAPTAKAGGINHRKNGIAFDVPKRVPLATDTSSNKPPGTRAGTEKNMLLTASSPLIGRQQHGAINTRETGPFVTSQEKLYGIREQDIVEEDSIVVVVVEPRKFKQAAPAGGRAKNLKKQSSKRPLQDSQEKSLMAPSTHGIVPAQESSQLAKRSSRSDAAALEDILRDDIFREETLSGVFGTVLQPKNLKRKGSMVDREDAPPAKVRRREATQELSKADVWRALVEKRRRERLVANNRAADAPFTASTINTAVDAGPSASTEEAAAVVASDLNGVFTSYAILTTDQDILRTRAKFEGIPTELTNYLLDCQDSLAKKRSIGGPASQLGKDIVDVLKIGFTAATTMAADLKEVFDKYSGVS